MGLTYAMWQSYLFKGIYQLCEMYVLLLYAVMWSLYVDNSNSAEEHIYAVWWDYVFRSICQ